MPQNRCISLFYGTARVNLDNFRPLTNNYRNTEGEQKTTDYDVSKAGSIIFARMTVSPGDGIGYEETDSSKKTDVPILVSIQQVKLDRPVQISGNHMGRPNKPYTGSPRCVFLPEDSAHRLLEDSVKANPHLRERLEGIFDLASQDRPSTRSHHGASDNDSYYPTFEDYHNTRRKLLRGKKTNETSVEDEDMLDTMQDSIERSGRTLASDWRTVTAQNILIWSQKGEDENAK